MNYCMSTGLQLPRKILNPEVLIIRGDLNDEMMSKMPEVEVLIVNGNVHLTTNHPIILPELVILGNCDAKHLCMQRSLIVIGSCTAQYVSCAGNLTVGPGSAINDYFVPRGEVVIGN